ncbi:MAG TPA: YdeI/OmpD-associated family protein [Gemmatimonadales bacterium]|nr:YdeI/OmpD-associated family protein [Gemmatimonadales bacterium]
MKLGKTLYVKNRKAWRAWLARHHKTAREIWVVYYKKGSGKRRIPYNDAVEEALCYGWIDSILKPIDSKKYAQRFSPRKKTSVLSEMNRERVRRLSIAGRMTKAGLAAIAHVEKKVWKIPAEIEGRLKKDAVVWRNFQRFPSSYKRIRIGWIEAARSRRSAFEQRLRYFLKMTKQNKRFGMVQ